MGTLNWLGGGKQLAGLINSRNNCGSLEQVHKCTEGKLGPQEKNNVVISRLNKKIHFFLFKWKFEDDL